MQKRNTVHTVDKYAEKFCSARGGGNIACKLELVL